MRTAVVVGYSGRDFSVFPWLARKSGIERIIWIDRSFNEDSHRSFQLPDNIKCVRIQCSIEMFAGKVEDLLRQKDPLFVFDQGESVCDLEQACITQAISALSSLPKLTQTKILEVIARVYSDIGNHKFVDEMLTNYINCCKKDLSMLYLQRAFCRASQDRYLDSIRDCRLTKLFAICKYEGLVKLVTLWYRSTLLSSYCRLIFFTQVVDPGKNEPKRRCRRFIYSAPFGVCYVLITLFLMPLTLLYIKKNRHVSLGNAAPTYRASCEGLESIIRIIPMLSILSSIIPISVLEVADKLSHEIGYLMGMLNVEKYYARIGMPSEKLVFGRLGVINDAIPLSIMKRDRAQSLLDDYNKSTNERQRFRLVTYIDNETRRGIFAAKRGGSLVLLLELACIRNEAGLVQEVPKDLLLECLRKVQILSTMAMRMSWERMIMGFKY